VPLFASRSDAGERVAVHNGYMLKSEPKIVTDLVIATPRAELLAASRVLAPMRQRRIAKRSNALQQLLARAALWDTIPSCARPLRTQLLNSSYLLMFYTKHI